MIKPEDIDYHHDGSSVGHEWAETNYFGFYIAEERLLGSIYNVVRAGLGVCSSEIIIYDGLSHDRMHVVHHDAQQHLPAPESLSDYLLPNGLHVRAVNPPRNYRVDYAGRDGTELHLSYEAVTDPFDIHDPAQNVRAAQTASDQAANSSFGAAYKGHFDHTLRVTGELKLGGKMFKIDCLDTMDHSWGPRAEHGMKSQCWLHGHFDDLVVHLILQFKPWAPREQQYELAHGYVIRDGSTHSITRASVAADRTGLLGVGMTVEVMDSSGRSHEMRGAAIAGGSWPCYLSLHAHNVLHRWVTDEGRVGHGVVQENWPMEQVARRNRAAMIEVHS